MQQFSHIDAGAVRVLLCDADGNLFPSEEPAFDASVGVTNRFLQRFGLPGNRTADQLRKETTGKNFRTTAVELAVAGGVPLEAPLAVGRPGAVVASQDEVDSGAALTGRELEQWVREEKDVVTAHLGATLVPDPDVLGPLESLSRHFALAAVSSSASPRLDASFRATGLASLIPADVRFSAEDSLPVPTSKPDPAVYLFAADALGIGKSQGLAIEDAVAGAQSAVAAGFVTVGNVMFVPPEERVDRSIELRQAGVSAVIDSWRDLCDVLIPAAPVTAGKRVAAEPSR
ncbi:HAD family hydrolase [Mycolicibacterium baixiangningiae]|uniref:HAD family hydrolase n=1 Tax=Mycolicibacterium baixiangningiae TaxID=2761578 RepID=UPI001867DCD5|nr:HAD-IA family hydrolase [Mycolicibacterium baixiangningiae]